MKPIERRVVRLESLGRNGWRAYAARPAGWVPDTALLGYLAEVMGWPPNYEPSDAELEAIAAGEDGAT
jgi:hypothetical protein